MATVEGLGVPVAHYVGLDLSDLPPRSTLNLVLTGRVAASGLVTDPVAAAHLLADLAGRVFLGPRTSVQAALGLLHLRSCRPLHLPVTASGILVRPAPAAARVVDHFLHEAPSLACRTPVTGLLRST